MIFDYLSAIFSTTVILDKINIYNARWVGRYLLSIFPRCDGSHAGGVRRQTDPLLLHSLQNGLGGCNGRQAGLPHDPGQGARGLQGNSIY